MSTIFVHRFRGSTFSAFVAVFVSILILGNGATAAITDDETKELSELDLKTERVFVFKDGYCLVIKRATATTDDHGVVYTDDVPDSAVLGSFWAIPEQGTIQSMVAGWVDTESETTDEVNCTNVLEILKANIGKQCTFTTGKNQKFSGKILKILGNDDLPDDSAALTPAQRQQLHATRQPYSSLLSSHVTVSSVTGTHFLLRTDSGDVMVSASTVFNLTIKDISSTRQRVVKKKTSHKRLSMHFAKPNSKVDINIMYFRPDVRWIPTYRVNLTDKEFQRTRRKGNSAGKQRKSGEENLKVAEIFMQGELLNEAEDFEDVPMHLVVGVPNFRFRSVPSPLVLEASLRNALVKAAPTIMGGGGNNRFLNSQHQMSNALFQQRGGERGGHGSGMGPVGATASVEMPEDFATQAGNDLFVYEVGKLSLKKGERATVPVLRTEVAYRNVYSWDVEVQHSETYAATSAGATSPLVLSENKVWRNVELINSTEMPWTTGAVMFVDGYQPVAQELLTYTSPGGSCRVPVTVSVDMRGKVTDRETSRKLDAVTWRGKRYARIDGITEIELANNKSQSVDVEIRLRFGGKAKTASDEGTIKLGSYRVEDWTHHRGDAINNSSEVLWKTKVKPGGRFAPTASYDFLLRY